MRSESGLGLVGKKCGMTRIFSAEGVAIPVTVVEVIPNRVTHVKTVKTDGYSAVQVAAGVRRASRLNKAKAGHFAKAGVDPGSLLKEFRVNEEHNEVKVGDQLSVGHLFKVGEKVDVRGVTKGKGFAGVVKRYHFSTQPMSHGNSLSHRAPGSSGQNQTPGRVFKDKKMPGHLGDVNRSIQCQEIVRVDEARHVLLIKGAIPGAPGGMVIVKKSVKNKPVKQAIEESTGDSK